MIDLAYSREKMLADIRAPRDPVPVGELADPAARAAFVRSDAARLSMRVRTPEEILPDLNAALADRFAEVDPEELERSLLLPLKKAVGNAHKRGNRRDPQKLITLEVLVTRAGAFVQVSDQGEGFDVAAICERFRSGSPYYTHGGSGFRKFEKARGIVSFDDGGRTFRATFHARSDRPTVR